MRAKLIALLLLSAGALSKVALAQDEVTERDGLPKTTGDGHGWVAPTVRDKQVLREHGSKLMKVFLNLPGLGRLLRNHRDGAPGAAPPPNGKLVRPPGLGVQYRRYTDAPGDPESGEELTNFPRAVDNSTLPCFPPIFFQGELNSCTSVAVTYYQLTHMTGLVRGWDQKRAGAQRFSPLWTFNLINGGNNHGTFQSRAYAALLAHGAVSLKEMPYYSSSNPATNYRRWPDDPKLWQQALENRIEAFGVIQESNVVSLLRRTKQLLVNGHVLTAATAIDGWNKLTIADNPSSRLDNPYLGEFIATSVAAVPGNHCITIVGYNDDIWVDLNGNGVVDPGEKGALKIANSWGTADWNKGFRWLHYSALYAPRDAEEAELRQPALYANQVFWMTAARDYKPELVIQVDLPPMYRNEFNLMAGVGTFKPGASETFARNFAFADYNGGRFSVDGHRVPQNICAVLDVTRPASRFLAKDPEFFVHIDRPGGAPVIPHARLVETSTGTVHELVLSRTPQADTYSAHAPSLTGFDTRQLQILVPAQIDIGPDGSADIPIAIGDTGDARPDVDVKVFSCNASVLAANDLAIERDAGGHAHLRITRPSPATGSCVLMIYAADGLKSVNTAVRVNLLGGIEIPPLVTVGALRQEGLDVRIPFQIKATTGLAENVYVFFDVSNVDQVGSYEITGTGADRVLNLKLRYRAPFELSLSALDGRFVSANRVKVGP